MKNLAIAVLLIAAPVFGQPEPATTYEDVLFVEGSLPNVPDSSTIATKLPLPLQQTPASVGVVSEWLMEEQGSSVLGEALQNISGVNVQTQSGVADFFVVRGFDSIANGLVLVDGAMEVFPDTLTKRLAEDGRVVAGLVENGVTRLAAGRRAGGGIGWLRLAEMGIPRLPGCVAPKHWSF